MWDTNIPLTIFMFFVGSLIQSGLFYGTAVLVDKIWPKRTAEEYELKESLIDADNQKSNDI